jgi:hypothetical protein
MQDRFLQSSLIMITMVMLLPHFMVNLIQTDMFQEEVHILIIPHLLQVT